MFIPKSPYKWIIEVMTKYSLFCLEAFSPQRGLTSPSNWQKNSCYACIMLENKFEHLAGAYFILNQNQCPWANFSTRMIISMTKPNTWSLQTTVCSVPRQSTQRETTVAPSFTFTCSFNNKRQIIISAFCACFLQSMLVTWLTWEFVSLLETIINLDE